MILGSARGVPVLEEYGDWEGQALEETTCLCPAGQEHPSAACC